MRTSVKYRLIKKEVRVKRHVPHSRRWYLEGTGQYHWQIQKQNDLAQWRFGQWIYIKTFDIRQNAIEEIKHLREDPKTLCEVLLK